MLRWKDKYHAMHLNGCWVVASQFRITVDRGGIFKIWWSSSWGCGWTNSFFSASFWVVFWKKKDKKPNSPSGWRASSILGRAYESQKALFWLTIFERARLKCEIGRWTQFCFWCYTPANRSTGIARWLASGMPCCSNPSGGSRHRGLSSTYFARLSFPASCSGFSDRKIVDF